MELKTKPLSVKLPMGTAGQDPGFHTVCNVSLSPDPAGGQ